MTRSVAITLLSLVALLCGAVAASAAGIQRFDFESGAEGWAALSGKMSIAERPDRDGKALALPIDFPGEAVVAKAGPINWEKAKTLQVDVYVDAAPDVAFDRRDPVQLVLYIKDNEFHWYQTARIFEPPLRRWARYRIDVSGDSTEWAPSGHHRPWGERVRRQLQELGVKVFSRGKGQVKVYIDNIRVSVEPTPRPPLYLLNYRTDAVRVPRYGLFQAAFELSREYDNPFDPEEADVQGTFIAPSGEVTVVPGFFYQDYMRRLEKNREILIPLGRSEWRIRFAPREAGAYQYFITVFDGDRVKTARRSFTVTESNDHGFVRVSRKDRRYFEFEDGSFFFPIGHNVPATYNRKAADILGLTLLPYKGTFTYDGFIDGMSRGGENFARIWLASWSFGLEWSHGYDPHYHGVGVYNMENAWRLDYVLNRARQAGIYVQLAMTTFGHYRLSGEFEGDWDYSPYNVRNGGFLRDPWEFWASDRAQKHYQRMLRYVAARWGYDTHIASWEVSNEIDLASQYGEHRGEIANWHVDCANTLRRFDQGRHLVTTNFANWGHDPAIIGLDEIDYSSTNTYTMKIVDLMKQIYANKSAFKKPAIMAECGADFRGSTPEVTERYIQICLWSSYMMPFAGAGMQWWWDFIDDRDLYHYFKPLSLFAEGEERRSQGLEMAPAAVVDAKSGEREKDLRVESLRNDRMGYAWMCNEELFDKNYHGDGGVFADKKLLLAGLRDGRYVAEFWNTFTGQVMGRVEFTSSSEKAGFLLPTFRSNMALKIKPVTGGDTAAPAEAETPAATSP